MLKRQKGWNMNGDTSKRPGFWDKRFFGSNIALVIGLLGIAGGLTSLSVNVMNAGLFAILGSVTYRSAKQRKLGLVTNTWFRKVLESLAILIILLMVVLHTDTSLIDLVYFDPFTNLIIPAWVFVAYLVAISRPFEDLERGLKQSAKAELRMHKELSTRVLLSIALVSEILRGIIGGLIGSMFGILTLILFIVGLVYTVRDSLKGQSKIWIDWLLVVGIALAMFFATTVGGGS
ncbi:hypothetical protein HY524_00370 [Candidatus Berkelbacteria bacterium]|nr:hypothetical protein [Candidatus Berkelbacteria bacterium]